MTLQVGYKSLGAPSWNDLSTPAQPYLIHWRALAALVHRAARQPGRLTSPNRPSRPSCAVPERLRGGLRQVCYGEGNFMHVCFGSPQAPTEDGIAHVERALLPASAGGNSTSSFSELRLYQLHVSICSCMLSAMCGHSLRLVPLL